jgi:lysophospholipase L1-like esterase
MVSLLIGVNDQYQGKDIAEFQQWFEKLMAVAIEAGKRGNKSVFVLSIPDYGATPFGKSNAKQIGKELDAYNTICEDICTRMNVPFYNITDISRRASAEPSLIAPDDLHPSGKMYGLWVDMIVADVRASLR